MVTLVTESRKETDKQKKAREIRLKRALEAIDKHNERFSYEPHGIAFRSIPSNPYVSHQFVGYKTPKSKTAKHLAYDFRKDHHTPVGFNQSIDGASFMSQFASLGTIHDTLELCAVTDLANSKKELHLAKISNGLLTIYGNEQTMTVPCTSNGNDIIYLPYQFDKILGLCLMADSLSFEYNVHCKIFTVSVASRLPMRVKLKTIALDNRDCKIYRHEYPVTCAGLFAVPSNDELDNELYEHMAEVKSSDINPKKWDRLAYTLHDELGRDSEYWHAWRKYTPQSAASIESDIQNNANFIYQKLVSSSKHNGGDSLFQYNHNAPLYGNYRHTDHTEKSIEFWKHGTFNNVPIATLNKIATRFYALSDTIAQLEKQCLLEESANVEPMTVNRLYRLKSNVHAIMLTDSVVIIDSGYNSYTVSEYKPQFLSDGQLNWLHSKVGYLSQLPLDIEQLGYCLLHDKLTIIENTNNAYMPLIGASGYSYRNQIDKLSVSIVSRTIETITVSIKSQWFFRTQHKLECIVTYNVQSDTLDYETDQKGWNKSKKETYLRHDTPIKRFCQIIAYNVAETTHALQADYAALLQGDTNIKLPVTTTIKAHAIKAIIRKVHTL